MVTPHRPKLVRRYPITSLWAGGHLCMAVAGAIVYLFLKGVL